MATRFIGLAAAVLLLVLGGAALAQEDAAYERHYQRARHLFEHRDYIGALREYRAAYQAKPVPGVLFNLGQTHRILGNETDALGYYEMYLRKEPNPNPQILNELEQYITQVKALGEAAAQKKQQIQELLRQLMAAPPGRDASTAQKEEAPPPAQRPAPPPPPVVQQVPAKQAAPETPLYKRWWLWTAVAAGAVAVTAVGLGVGLGVHPQHGPPGLAIMSVSF